MAIEYKLSYTGDEINQKLSDVDSIKTSVGEHVENKNNPHQVTAEQVGAVTYEELQEALANNTNSDVLVVNISYNEELEDFVSSKTSSEISSAIRNNKLVYALYDNLLYSFARSNYLGFEFVAFDLRNGGSVFSYDVESLYVYDVGEPDNILYTKVDIVNFGSNPISLATNFYVDEKIATHLEEENPHGISCETIGAVAEEDLANKIETVVGDMGYVDWDTANDIAYENVYYAMDEAGLYEYPEDGEVIYHGYNTNNPHNVTCEQIGAATFEQLTQLTDELMNYPTVDYMESRTASFIVTGESWLEEPLIHYSPSDIYNAINDEGKNVFYEYEGNFYPCIKSSNEEAIFEITTPVIENEISILKRKYFVMNSAQEDVYFTEDLPVDTREIIKSYVDEYLLGGAW